MCRRTHWFLAVPAIVLFAVGLSAAPQSRARPHADPHGQGAKEALAQFNSLIGGWKGVGQPRRGSSAGSWQETAHWVWDFSGAAPAIRYEVTHGKIVKSARLTFDETSGLFRADVALANGQTRLYQGKLDDDRLVLESTPDAIGNVDRMTVTRLNEKRTVVLFERGRAKSRGMFRIAEVGYTREGTRLAVEGADGPECIVTGGKGTIKVTYKGQTFYVCCSGCKQAFDANPEKILAEYRQRLADRSKGTK